MALMHIFVGYISNLVYEISKLFLYSLKMFPRSIFANCHQNRTRFFIHIAVFILNWTIKNKISCAN